MAIISGTSGDDIVSLTTGQANDTIDLKSGDDTLTLPDVKTKVVITGVEHVTGGTADDQVTINDLPTLLDMDLGAGTDTLIVANGKNANFTSASLTSVEIVKTASSSGATFTFDGSDLASLTQVIGGAGNDT